MKIRLGWTAAVLIAIVCAAAVGGEGGVFGGKTGREICMEVYKAFGDENLRAAAKTANSEAVLGLAILGTGGLAEMAAEEAGKVYTGKTVAELTAAAAKADPANEAVLILARGGRTIGMDTASAVVQKDPSNALGYYLQASALVGQGKILDAVGAMRQGARCKRLDAYDAKIVRAITRALDALHLEGVSRIAAVARTPQTKPPVWDTLLYLSSEIGQKVDQLPEAERDGVADMLLAMAGQIDQLARPNPKARYTPTAKDAELMMAEYSTLASAFQIKQKIALAEESPRERAYSAAIGSLSTGFWQARATEKDKAIEKALSDAFSDVVLEKEMLEKMGGDVGTGTRAAVEKAIQDRQAAMERFIGSALKDLDAIIEWKLESGRGLAGIATERPDLAGEAADFLAKDSKAKSAVKEGVPAFNSQQNLQKLFLPLTFYAYKHKDTFPPDLETLVKEGYLTDKTLLTSPLSGKPYVYLGGKLPYSQEEIAPVVYDEAALASGERLVLNSGGQSGVMSEEEFNEKTKKKEQ